MAQDAQECAFADNSTISHFWRVFIFILAYNQASAGLVVELKRNMQEELACEIRGFVSGFRVQVAANVAGIKLIFGLAVHSLPPKNSFDVVHFPWLQPLSQLGLYCCALIV